MVVMVWHDGGGGSGGDNGGDGVTWCRFKDYDGVLLTHFIKLKQKAPISVHNALLREDFSTTDIAKLYRAIERLSL